MGTLLAKNATVLVTMDDDRREIENGSLLVRDNVIEMIGSAGDLPSTADEVIDLSRHIVLPGFINTHHHMYQTLTRALAQDVELFTWLKTLYPIWANLTDDGIYVSTIIALAELALSGCTTSSDHLYVFPNDCTLDSQIRAAGDIGVRFHAARGSMSLGESQGGLPPDRCTEDEGFILKDCQRLIETYHDEKRHAMLRIVLAPCSPFSVSPDLMRESASMARAYGVRLHTHLAETLDEETFCLQTFGQRPVSYIESLGWTGHDVWHAHCVHMNSAEIELFANSRTGIAHCPSSNMLLSSGIAPVVSWRQAGIRVGLGVDGSASNDGNDLLGEIRQALLLQKVAPAAYLSQKPGGRGGFAGDPKSITARQALELATRGGAAVLGRDDIGHLAPGMSADFIALDLNQLAFAGAHDPVAALAYCRPSGVDISVINGTVVVREGKLTTIDLPPLLERHRKIAVGMARDEL